MAGNNPFLKSPLDLAIEDAERSRPAAAAAQGIDLPDFGQVDIPKVNAVPAVGKTKTGNLGIPFQRDFEDIARKYKVPVNILIGLAEQESSFLPSAYNKESGATGLMQYIPETAKAMGIDPLDPRQSIEAAAKQYAERLRNGMSFEDAIKEHFAGPDRKKWGPKTEQYGKDVIARAKKYGRMYKSGQFLPDDPAAPANDNAAPATATGGPTVSEVVEPTRTWGETAGDTGVQLAEGVNTVLGAVPNLIAPDSSFADFFNKNADYWRSKQSKVLQDKIAAADQRITKAGEDGILAQLVQAATEYASDPALAGRLVTTTAPSLVPGVAAAKVAQAASIARGATAVKAAAAATTAAGATNAALNAGGARGQAYEDIKQTLMKQGLTEEEASRAALDQSVIPAVVGGVAGFVSGKTGLEKVVAGGATSGGVRAGIGAAAAELAGEQIEEVAPQVATNIVASKYDDRSAGKDVGRTIVETGIGAGPGSAVSGVAAGLSKGQPEQPREEAPAAPAAAGINPEAPVAPAEPQAAAPAGAAAPAAPVMPDAPQGAAPAQPAAQPAAAPAQPSGPLARAIQKGAPEAALAGDVVNQEDLEARLDEAIARGEAGQIDTTGAPVVAQQVAMPAAAEPTPAAAAAQGIDAGTENIDFRAERQRALDERARQQQSDTANKSFGDGAHKVGFTASRNDDGTYTVSADYLIHTQGRDEASPGGSSSNNVQASSADEAIEKYRQDKLAELDKSAKESDRKAGSARDRRPELVADFERARDLSAQQAAALRGEKAAQPKVERKPIAGVSVKEDIATTPAGRNVDVEYRVVEASDLVTSNDDAGNINPDYPQSLQPRDRTRATSELQINDIAANLNPRQVTEGPMTTDGAPIVSPEGVVESGNGRTLAIRRAYARNPEAAQRYRDHLAGMGVDVADMKQPVLVRVRKTAMSDEELVDYTRESNERTTLALGATERAQADAKVVPSIIEDFKGGDVVSAANRDFVRKFIQGAVSKADQGSMVGPDGQLTKDGRRRVEAAIMASAYGDTALVSDLFESADSDIKAIGGALMDAAPQWAKMRSQAEALAEGIDITDNLLDAVNIVRRARAEGKPVSEIVNNGDMFAGDVPQITRDVLRWFYKGDRMAQARSRKDVAQSAIDYVEQALQTKAGPGLFGDDVPQVKNTDILRGINDKARAEENRAASQSDFFGARTGRNEQDAGEAGREDGRPVVEPRAEAPAEAAAEGLTEEQAKKLKEDALARAKGVLSDDEAADIEEAAQDKADNIIDFWRVSAQMLNEAVDKRLAEGKKPKAEKPEPATTPDGEKLYTKGVAAMQAAQRTKKTGEPHEAIEVDGGWVVRKAGERRAAPAAGEPRERRIPGRTPPTSARDVWHDKLAEDVRKDEEGSETYGSLPADVRRRINEERLAARMKGEPLPIDPTSGLINGKEILNKDATEQGTAKGTMLEGMLNSAVNHVKAGGKAFVAEIDLGNLGGINHFSGQVGGDRAIADVSGVISKAFDDAGLGDAVDLARYGGDEFFMVARNGDSGAIGRALAAANKDAQEYMNKTTPRMLNPGLEAEVNGLDIAQDEKTDLLRFIDTPLSKLSKKPVTKPNGEKEYPQGKTKIHVGNLVEVKSGDTAAGLHAAADSSLAMAKNANYKEKSDEQATDELAGVRGDAEQGAQGAAGREDRAGRGAQDADGAVDEDDGERAAGGGEVAPGVEGAAGQVNERFANNKLFTADKVAAAHERMRKKLNGSQLNAGFDLELLTDGMTIAGAYIEAGVRDFSAFAKQMAEDFGDTVKPYLLSFWEGARNYPGLDTDGMTDQAESARLHKALLAEKPVTDAAKEAIGTTVEKPKSTKKASGTSGDKRLRQDWGVDNIDGYAESDEFEGAGQTDWGIKGGVKDAFLKDAKGYMTAVASLLEAAGFEAKYRKAVSANEGGPAVSGDVSLSMKRGDVHVYATVGASSLRGVVPGTGAGVAVMFRAGKKDDTKGVNRWVSPDLPARDLAALIAQEADRAAEQKEKANEPRQLDQDGARALEGAPAAGVQAPAAQGPSRAGAQGRGAEDARGNERARGAVDGRARGLGNAQGEVPAPAAGEAGAGSQPAGAGADAGGAAGSERGPGTGVGARVASLPAQDRADDFSITDADEIGEGGAKAKFNNNVAAIKLLKELQAQDRPATRAEQAVLAKYVGWGGLPQAFYREGGAVTNGWEKQAAELKGLLTPDEYSAAAASTKDAHYTSPEIVAGIWKAVEQFGFRGGRVLEPSVGVGNFFGLMPKDARAASQLVGVELDAITGGIAKMLYPAANVQTPVGFQDVNTPTGYFDLAIGNPPFGATKIYDGKRRDLNGLSIHNYFFAKSVDALKPGGVLAMVVTNRFMDANDQKARKLITDKADLVGAIRLPNNAFLKNAGTEVTTDIIFLRKRKDDEAPAGETWMDVSDYTDKDGNTVPLNEYFHRHPENMLGEFGAYSTMYRAGESALVAREGQNTGKMLADAIARMPSDIMATAGHEPTAEVIAPASDISAVKVGSMYVDGGKVMVRLEDELGQQRGEPVDFPNEKARERAVGMIKVRDALTDLRRLQLSSNAESSAIETARADLNKAYDAFAKEFGPLNVDANKRVFRDDPSWPQLSALEDDFDRGVSAAIAAKTGEPARKPSAKKAAIFSKRTQSPYKPPTSANTAKDAMVASLAEVGRIDMAYMRELYGKTEEQMAKELAGLIYRNPVGGWETRDQYLSGNVKQKLAMAEAAAKEDPAYRENVEALREVQPADVDAVDIGVKVGAHWLPPADMSAFASHISGDSAARASYNPIVARWGISAGSSSSAHAQYGTGRVSVSEVITAAANQKTIQVFDTMPDETRVLNERETQAANEKVLKVNEEFKRWIWSDDSRRVRLARLYNDTFNTDRLREYDGAHLTLPGKIGDDIIKLRPHQANAVWRIIQSPTTLTDHVVGAGKTFTLIAAAMEMRRMGLANKPMFVVPNHLVGQWASDFIKLYPGANILAASKKDFDKENRKRLFSRIATGDWDAVVVAHSSFGKIGVTPEFEGQFIKQQIDDIETSLTALRSIEGKKARNVKQVEKMKAALEEKYKRLFDQEGKDDAIYFDELGVDALFLDEAHEFKNLAFSTSMQRVAGLGNPTGSQKAADLFMKVQQVKSRTGGRNIVFATGTPISNTMAEMFTMQRYLDYSVLKAQGLAHFDAWARMYGEVVTDWELSPSGQYKMNSRFAKFVNMPELMQRYGSFADVINRDDINRMLAAQGKTLPVPKVKGGKPQNIVVERSNDQAIYIGIPVVDENGNEKYPEGSLVYRAENLPKKAEKGADNMLKIMSDARKAALDMRLIDPSYPDNPKSKVNEAADRILANYKKWDADKGAQLVFIDLSTPKSSRGAEAARIRELIARADEGDMEAQEALDKMNPDDLLALESDFSVYDDLREKLIARGIPADEIAFIHDATTEDKKEVLFGKVRSGRVRVMFGSTAKMGAGMNVQERLVALHHLDAPWRPSDLEQREGRIIRQGNKLRDRDPDNFEVEINRYATKQTLDSRMWQTIEAKARFIEQVRKGNTGGREIEDVGGEAANSAEMKAASSGNPLILEEMDLRQKVRKLTNEGSEHDREQFRIKDLIRSKKLAIERNTAGIPNIEADIKRAPKEFVVTIGKTSHDKPKDAGAAILLRAAQLGKDASKDSMEIGSYGDFKLMLDKLFGDKFVLTAVGAGEYQVEIKDLTADPTGLAMRLKNTISQLPESKEWLLNLIESDRQEIPKLEAQIAPWPKADELERMKLRHMEVIDQLKPKRDNKKPDAQDDGGKASVGKKWYVSQLERAVEAVKQDKANVAQWKAMLQKAPGVKAEELEWTGVLEWLDGKAGSVTKGEVAEFVRANGVQIEEVKKGELDPEEHLPDGWEIREGDEGWEVVDDEGDVVTTGETREEALENAIDTDYAGQPGDPSTKYSKYQLPGGNGYTELLLTLPRKTDRKMRYKIVGAYPMGVHDTKEAAQAEIDAFMGRLNDPANAEVANAIRPQLERMPLTVREYEDESSRKEDYRSSHWEEPNVLAHIRFNTRSGPNGERIMHIEEIQSDWHQAGRKRGYLSKKSSAGLSLDRTSEPGFVLIRDKDGNQVGGYSDASAYGMTDAQLIERFVSGQGGTDGVPNAPFKDTSAWSMLAMKRMIRYATENGYDAITWTGGEAQAERYDLSKQVDSIRYGKSDDGTFRIAAIKGRNDRVFEESGVTEQRLESLVGKEIAAKIINGDGKKVERNGNIPEHMELSGLDLKVGGQGMIGFYDKILPSETNKLLKKYGGKVEHMHASGQYSHEFNFDGPNPTIDDVENVGTKAAKDIASRMADGNSFADAFDIAGRVHGQRAIEDLAATLGGVVKQRGSLVDDSFQGFRLTPELRAAAEAGLPLFSKKQEPQRRGMTAEAVDAAIRSAGFGGLIDAGKVVVHADVSGLPGKWSTIEGVQAVAMPDGTIHFAANGIDREQDVMPALMHEAFHTDVEPLIGTPAWNNLQRELGALYRQGQRSSGKMGEFWKKAAERAEDAEVAGAPMSDSIRVEEFGAYAIEEYESAPPVVKGWVDRVLAKVKAWLLQRFGKQFGTVTPAQLRELAKMALRDASAKPSPTGGGQPRASMRQRLPMQEQSRNRFAVPPETRGQKLQRIFQDRFNRVAIVQRVVAEQGGTVSEASNVYQAEERYHGRVTARVEDFAKQEIEPFIKAVAEAGVTLDEVAEYAYAEHAPERNAYIATINDRFADGNGSGMTDEQAAEVIAGYQAEGKGEKLAALTAQLREIGAGTRKMIVSEGLESADTVDAWEAMFGKYVPLKGFQQADEFGNEEQPSTPIGSGGKGFSVRGKETKAAMGRASRASQIIENVVAQRERAIMRAEKNRVAKSLLRLVVENPDKSLWEVNEVKDKPVLTAGGRRAITDIFSDQPTHAPVQDGRKVKYKKVAHYGDDVVTVKVKGREVQISIKDPVLAEQLHMRDARELPPLFAQLNQVNRVLARLWTSLNPVFTLTNYLRDIQAAALNAYGSTNARVATKTVGYAAPGGWAMRAVLDGMRGKDSEGALWYERYRQAGGKTGFMTFDTLEDKTKKLEDMLRDARGDRNKLIAAGAKVIEVVEDANAIVENAVRLAAFRAAIEDGMSPAQAASLSKNLTVNFNRRGEWTHFFGALYLFFNPAVQGTARLGQALQKPKVQAAAAGLVAGALALGLLGRAMGGDDDDGEPYYDKIPASVKDRNLIIMLPGTKGDYIKVAMPYGYSFFASLGNAIYDAGATDKSKVKIAADLGTAFANSFNPVGDGMPTVFTPAAQVAMNEDRFGRQIMPEQGKYETPKPDSQLYFPSMEGTVAQKATAALNAATGGTEVRPGLVDVSPETVEHVYQFVTGGLGTSIKDVVKYLTQDEQEASTLPFAKQVFGKQFQAAPVNKFYENATEAELADTERELYEGRGDDAALAKFNAEHGWQADMAKRAQKLRKQLAKVRRESKDVMADEALPEAERLRSKREIMDEMNAMATDFNRDWNRAKAEAKVE